MNKELWGDSREMEKNSFVDKGLEARDCLALLFYESLDVGLDFGGR